MNASERERLRDIEKTQVTIYRRLANSPEQFRTIIPQLIALRDEENKIRGTSDAVDIDKYVATFKKKVSGKSYYGKQAAKRKSSPERDAYFQKDRG